MTLKNDKLLALLDQHTLAFIKKVETPEEIDTATNLGIIEHTITKHIEKFGGIAPSKPNKPKTEK